ncbi:PAS domain S-box protein [Zunongwangia sp. SCSIO 43204]|uniref:PAS domain S-box protein n=1 Tax=Zunongwangia sp. SCSIO 43204 TaxID=2779359 RepID=UPI001CA9924A|nr:PAS domain S-box protein [Zunongwangia sp. SCSIO 43204]UAB83764.1 PAS domain S-box protein [Zunongwangia sp. SCSIO 43204]
MALHFKDLHAEFKNLIAENANLISWFGEHIFECIWFVDIAEEAFWGNFEKVSGNKKILDFEHLSELHNEEVSFLQFTQDFIVSKEKDKHIDFYSPDIEAKKWRFHFKKMRCGACGEKDYVFILQQYIPFKEKYLSLHDENSYLKKLNEVFDKTNEIASVGGWMVDIVNSKVLWTKVTKAIHEVDDDYEPNVPDGINFYLEGENRERITRIFTKAVEEGSSFMDDFEILSAKGNKKWVKVFGNAETEDGKTVRVYGAFQDITEQKLQDFQLQTTQSRFQGIFDTSPLGIILVEPVTNKVFHANKAAIDLFGYNDSSLEDIYKLSLKDVIHEDDLEMAATKRKKLIEGDFDSYRIECRFHKKDGTIIWVQSFTSLLRNEDGTPKLIITQVEDITARRALEAESYKNASQFKSAFDYSPNGMALVSLNGQWINVNRNLSKMIGYTNDELLQMSFMDVTYSEDLDKDLSLLNKLLAGEIDTYSMEKRYIHKEGYLLWGLLTVSLLKDESGKPIYFISQINDITAAKEAQENINKGFRELQNLMEATTQVSIIESDLNGVIKKFNRGAENFFGYKAKDVIDKEKVFILHDQEEIKQREIELSEKYGREIKGFDVFTTGPKVKDYESLEWTYIRKNGERFPVQLVVTAIKNAQNEITGYVGVATDISQLKAIQEELKQSEQRWQFALEGSGDGIWDWFIDTNTQFLSKRAKEMLGFDESDELSDVEEWDQRIHPNDREKSEKALEDYFNGNVSVYHIEKRIKCKDGEYKWILDRGKVTDWTEDKKPLRMIGTQSDITDRKIAERKIKQNEARFRSLYELSPIGIGLIDVENGTFVEANQSLIASSGYTKEEFTGMSYRKITPKEFIPLAQDRFGKVVLNGKVEPFEKNFIKKDGTIYPALVNGAKIKDSNGRDIILATIQDITKRKDMENSLVEAKLKAEAASKSKSEFLANMSHEIRTPLNGVIGFTDLLMKTELNASQKQYMETVYNSANTLLDLINDILDFSKIEAGKLELSVEKVNLIELCGQTVDVVKHKAHEKGLEVLLNISPDVDRYIYGDSVRIRQILTNLLGNSVKFTNQGEIELRIEAGEINQENKREYTFIVRDTGIGIAPQNLERIFKAFDQEDASTTRKYGGTGLGLTISNKLLYLMDSKLNLSSELGVGSTFSFKVCFESEGGESFLSDNLGKIKDVLVIDDNYNNQVILKEMLAMEDINCDAVSNAIEALNVLEKENKYQLAIVDYNMPYMTGIDFIAHLRNDLKVDAEQLPLILLHSSAEEEKLGKSCEELNVQFNITKPIKIDQLFGMLNQIQAPLKNIEEHTVDVVTEKTFEDKFRILVAEDNPVNKFLAKTILTKAVPNAEIFEVENGLDAVAFYKVNPIDIIFMDIQMPIMSGFEASEEIRKFEAEQNNDSHIPIVALTARTIKGEKDRCLEAGMDDYITKPVVFETIKSVIEEFLLNKNDDLENTSSLQHFDKQKLLEKFDYDKNTYNQLIQIVKQSLDDYPKQLRRQIEHRDLEGINKLGHKIKGSAQNCCFYKLEYLAAKLEEFNLFKESLLLDLEKEIEAEINLLKDSI